MKRALLLMNPAAPDGAVCAQVAGVLNDIYDGLFQIEYLPEFDRINCLQLHAYSMVILGARLSGPRQKHMVAALTAYVADGGSLLALGRALDTEQCFELNCLLGAALLGAGTPCLMDFQPQPHPIMQLAQPFSLTGPTRFVETDPILAPDLLLNMRYAHRSYPAAWCHSYAWGKVACMTIGDIAEDYLPEVRRLLWKIGLWALDRL